MLSKLGENDKKSFKFFKNKKPKQRKISNNICYQKEQIELKHLKRFDQI